MIKKYTLQKQNRKEIHITKQNHKEIHITEITKP